MIAEDPMRTDFSTLCFGDMILQDSPFCDPQFQDSVSDQLPGRLSPMVSPADMTGGDDDSFLLSPTKPRPQKAHCSSRKMAPKKSRMAPSSFTKSPCSASTMLKSVDENAKRELAANLFASDAKENVINFGMCSVCFILPVIFVCFSSTSTFSVHPLPQRFHIACII